MKSLLKPIAMFLLIAPSAVFGEPTIKVGAILPLTGEGAFWGENARNGALMAVSDINAKGGINGKRLKLIIEDGKCEAKDAVSAMKKLTDVDKVIAVIGEICDTASQAIAPIAQRKQIVAITPCSEAPSITIDRDFVFRTWAPNSRQGKFMAQFARKERKAKKAAVLAISNDFGIPLSEAFVDEFKLLGGKIVSNQTYTPGAKDLKPQLLRIKKTNPDVIYLVSFHSGGILAVKQMAALGITQQILGASPINSKEGFFDPLGSKAEGIILSDLEDTTTQEFRTRYGKQFRKDWPGVSSCAAVAYDDVALLGAAIKKFGEDRKKIRDYLAATKDFPGVSGEITFDQNGDLDRSHSIFIVKNGKLANYFNDSGV